MTIENKTKRGIQVNHKSSKLRNENIQLKSDILRYHADIDNMRKRFEARSITQSQLVKQEIISELLPVLDNFKRATGFMPETQDPKIANWAVGVIAVEKQLEEILAKFGLRVIEIEVEQQFDHNYHEAISHEPSDKPVDSIIEITQDGYKLDGMVIRPAHVRVSSGNIDK